MQNKTSAQNLLSDDAKTQRRKERRLFLFIVVFLFPLLTFALVGAYGFSIWMYQLVMGPPGAG
jgi:nitrate reductase NapE